MRVKIRFDQGPLGAGTYFDAATQLIEAREPAEVPAAFEALAKAQADGKWLAGYATYELGYALEERLTRYCRQWAVKPV